MKRFGMIDIGSNTIRLVIFHYHKDTGLKELKNIKAPARLATFVDEDGVMGDKGIENLVSILHSFDAVAKDNGVSVMYPVATAAIRASKNLDQIKEIVKDKVGMDLIVITGEEEAYYGYNAVSHTISNLDAVTIDIGGASCEITHYEDKELIESISLPFGVVTLSNMFFDGNSHNDKQAIKKCEKYVRESLSKVRWLSSLNIPVIAIGGSARNIARIHQSMTNYPIAGVHGYSLSDKDLDDVYQLIVDTDEEDLDNIDGLSKERTDIIFQSAIVFKEIYKLVEATMFKFSRQGLREGYAIEVIQNDYPDAFTKFNIFDHSLKQIGNDFHIKELEGLKRREIAGKIYQELHRYSIFQADKYEKRLMKSAAYLFDLGEFIDKDASSQHTFYILSNSNLNGVTHKDRVKLALLASYKNRSLLEFFAEESGWFSESEIDNIHALGSILKFSNALDISNTGVVKDVVLNYDADESEAELVVKYVGDPISEEYQSNRQKKHIEKILDKDLVINFVEA